MSEESETREAARGGAGASAGREVTFPNGNRARVVVAPADGRAAEIVGALGVARPKSLLLVMGGADKVGAEVMSRLEEMFTRGIEGAAAEAGALVIDGGTDSGVMRLMGRAVAGGGRRTPLLGVSPGGLVSYPRADESGGEGLRGGERGPEEGRTPLEPNHTHFVLVESDRWGGETEMIFRLAEELGRGVPVLTLVVNGGPIVKDEVLHSVRQGWPVVLVEGSGRMADEIACLWRQRPARVDDPALEEIITRGRISLFPVEGGAGELRALVARLLGGGAT